MKGKLIIEHKRYQIHINFFWLKINLRYYFSFDSFLLFKFKSIILLRKYQMIILVNNSKIIINFNDIKNNNFKLNIEKFNI